MSLPAKLLLLLFSLGLAGCCTPFQRPRDYGQTHRPDSVRGWKAEKHHDIDSVAELVLKKGESSSNNEFGVEAVNIIPPDLCAEPNSYHGSVKAVLRFYSPVDKRVFCERTFIIGGAGVDSECPDLRLNAVTVRAINPEEGWVWFELID